MERIKAHFRYWVKYLTIYSLPSEKSEYLITPSEPNGSESIMLNCQIHKQKLKVHSEFALNFQIQFIIDSLLDSNNFVIVEP